MVRVREEQGRAMQGGEAVSLAGLEDLSPALRIEYDRLCNTPIIALTAEDVSKIREFEQIAAQRRATARFYGEITAVANGDTQCPATAGGQPCTADGTVGQVPHTVTVTPELSVLDAGSGTGNVAVVVQDALGNPIVSPTRVSALTKSMTVLTAFS